MSKAARKKTPVETGRADVKAHSESIPKEQPEKPAAEPENPHVQEKTKAGVTPVIKPRKDKTLSANDLHKISLKINTVTKEASPKGEIESPLSQPKESSRAFSKEAFFEAWNTLAQQYKNESLGLYLAMSRYKPKLTDDGIIQVKIDNAIQEDIIEEKKPEILGKIYKELGHYNLKINTFIHKSKSGQKVYLPEDKLNKLIEKNPHIKRLRKDLGLDLLY